MIQKATLVLFALFLTTSVWVFGHDMRARLGSHTRMHRLLDSAHRQSHHQQFHHQQFHHPSFHLHQQFHHQLFRFHHGFIHNFQFFRRRPLRVPAGFKLVRIPGQRVKSGRSSKWFVRRWATIKSDRKSISTTELVPVWSSGQWSLKWKETVAAPPSGEVTTPSQ